MKQEKVLEIIKVFYIDKELGKNDYELNVMKEINILVDYFVKFCERYFHFVKTENINKKIIEGLIKKTSEMLKKTESDQSLLIRKLVYLVSIKFTIITLMEKENE